MHDTSLPLTTSEYEEWGNPAEPEVEAYLATYSPYENVTGARYPALLVTAGFNDPRVSYHEPAKWVAKLRATTDSQSGPLVMWTELGAGHGGPSGRYDSWREEARVNAFVLSQLGCD
jgi:oligopeptidase B